MLGLAELQRNFKTGIFPTQPQIPGELLGASSQFGHWLRTGSFPPPTQTIETSVVIVGSGISGLAAGYRLKKAGFEDFIVLELESESGGNAHSGRNAVSAYPWGAHYVPLLTEEALAVRNLFEELGIIQGYSATGLPIYDDYFLCHDPNERLHYLGRWQDGLVPLTGISADDEAQYRKFFRFIAKLKQQTGEDGKKLFAIPLDHSSQDARWLALDGISMRQWLEAEGFRSRTLLWYIEYCCRDDFGTTLADTSAWAALHYFAARTGKAANSADDGVITWPEGNGWLAKALAKPILDKITPYALCYAVKSMEWGVIAEYLKTDRQASVSLKAKAAILATPRFITSRLVQMNQAAINSEGFSYSPWAVANITLRRLPQGKGAPLSWDNVVYGSPFIGYVNAGHQIPQMSPVGTVITYYWPLSHLPPDLARKEALARSYSEWQALFLDELLRIHPELEKAIDRIDIWLWGHGMIRPTPGFIWGQRKQALVQEPPIFTAHSDMSGISLFEEAYTRGVSVADSVLAYVRQKQAIRS